MRNLILYALICFITAANTPLYARNGGNGGQGGNSVHDMVETVEMEVIANMVEGEMVEMAQKKEVEAVWEVEGQPEVEGLVKMVKKDK
jgi:hypothetical protein